MRILERGPETSTSGGGCEQVAPIVRSNCLKAKKSVEIEIVYLDRSKVLNCSKKRTNGFTHTQRDVTT